MEVLNDTLEACFAVVREAVAAAVLVEAFLAEASVSFVSLLAPVALDASPPHLQLDFPLCHEAFEFVSTKRLKDFFCAEGPCQSISVVPLGAIASWHDTT